VVGGAATRFEPRSPEGTQTSIERPSPVTRATTRVRDSLPPEPPSAETPRSAPSLRVPPEPSSGGPATPAAPAE
jgi:hypothetical protein